jgi:CheY-like chemotaxis protein
VGQVVYLVRDLVFTARIREAAEQLGVSVQGVRDAASCVTAARAARLVIVDLRLPEAFAALESLARDPKTAAVPTVGFVGHEALDAMQTARALGCREVLAKGEFVRRLPGLLVSAIESATPARREQ